MFAKRKEKKMSTEKCSQKKKKNKEGKVFTKIREKKEANKSVHK